MAIFLTRLLGLLLLTVAIIVPSCEGLFAQHSSMNVPEQSPAALHDGS